MPAVVCHFSEDPTITEFTPHVAKTADDPRPLVWAVDESRTPGYWFPRDCPRAMAWVVAGTTDEDRRYVLGPGGDRRVHAVEYRWLERIASCQLYRYDLPADSFRLVAGEAPHAYVSESAVRPVEPPVRLPGAGVQPQPASWFTAARNNHGARAATGTTARRATRGRVAATSADVIQR